MDHSLLDEHMHMHAHTHTHPHAHLGDTVQRALGLSLISCSACDLPYSSCLALPWLLADPDSQVDHKGTV